MYASLKSVFEKRHFRQYKNHVLPTELRDYIIIVVKCVQINYKNAAISTSTVSVKSLEVARSMHLQTHELLATSTNAS